MVEIFDERRIVGDAAVGKRLSLSQLQRHLEFRRGDVRVARDLEFRHAVLRAAPDRERDDELRVALLARMRRLRLAIAEVAQIVLDSVGRVLEQVLVDRSLAFDRHELVAPITRQWIAGEDDADVRTRIDGERDVGDAVLVGELNRGGDLGFVVAALAAILDVAFQPRGEPLAPERRALDEIDSPQQLASRQARRAGDVDGAYRRTGAGLERERQRCTLGRMIEPHRGRHRRMQVPVCGQRIRQEADHVARAPDWRRRAVAIGDDAAQRADIDTGGARASGESDVSDRMDRAELVA